MRIMQHIPLYQVTAQYVYITTN